MAKRKVKGNTVTKILRTGLKLIQKGWAQGAEFKYANGVEIDESDLTAVKRATNFCAIGAVNVQGFLKAGLTKTHVALARLDEATRLVTRETRKTNDDQGIYFGESEFDDVVEYNDVPGRKKAQIVAVYKKAISLQTHRSA